MSLSAGLRQVVGSYYAERPEIVAVVPPTARHVLDVGCGEGSLGRQLKRDRPAVQVRGIEPSPAPAALARACLDGVHVGGAEDVLPPEWPAPDCIVFADCLEHMLDPWSVLARLTELLAPGGSVVISLPNVAHHTVLLGALRGRWDYADSGLLDRTHVRFFTRLTLLELLAQAGLAPVVFERVFRGPRSRRLANFLERVGRLVARPDSSVLLRSRATVADLLTYQYLVVARRLP